MADNEELGVLELDQNLADVEKPPEIPPNVYTAEIQDVQMATSGKGNDYYAIRFVIPADELPADIQSDYEDGVILFWNRQIVPKKGDRRALFSLRKFIEAIGLNANTTTIDPNEWMGQTARLRVVHGKYQGETRAEIKSIEAAEVRRGAVSGRGRAAREEAGEAPAAPARGRAAAPARGRK